MSQMIKSIDELVGWFFSVDARPGMKERLQQGVLVDAAVREAIMLDDRQGRIMMNGKLCQVAFEDKGENVYRAFLQDK